jgi:hypothetical protein
MDRYHAIQQSRERGKQQLLNQIRNSCVPRDRQTTNTTKTNIYIYIYIYIYIFKQNNFRNIYAHNYIQD